MEFRVFTEEKFNFPTRKSFFRLLVFSFLLREMRSLAVGFSFPPQRRKFSHRIRLNVLNRDPNPNWTPIRCSPRHRDKLSGALCSPSTHERLSCSIFGFHANNKKAIGRFSWSPPRVEFVKTRLSCSTRSLACWIPDTLWIRKSQTTTKQQKASHMFSQLRFFNTQPDEMKRLRRTKATRRETRKPESNLNHRDRRNRRELRELRVFRFSDDENIEQQERLVSAVARKLPTWNDRMTFQRF